MAVQRPERLARRLRLPGKDEQNAPDRTAGETVRVETRATSNGSDVSRGDTEELKALRAII